MFASLRPNQCHFCPLFKELLTGVGKMFLALEKSVVTGQQLPPNVNIFKKPYFQEKHKGTLAHWI